MAQLGYTWYPKDWLTSTTRRRLKRFPMVKYAIREIFDLMYIESGAIEMNREYLLDDLDIELTDIEYKKLLEYIEIQEDGKWLITSIKTRISKAEAARENGKKGGRPPKEKKTQEPRKKTQEENPKNPPLESKIETKEKGKEKKKITSSNDDDVYYKLDDLVYGFLKNERIVKAVSETLEIPDKKTLKKSLHEFQKHIEASGTFSKTKSDFGTHFRNWYKVKQKNTPKPDSWESGKLKRF